MFGKNLSMEWIFKLLCFLIYIQLRKGSNELRIFPKVIHILLLIDSIRRKITKKNLASFGKIWMFIQNKSDTMMLISFIIKLNKIQIKKYQDNFEPNKDLRFENCIKSFDKF